MTVELDKARSMISKLRKFLFIGEEANTRGLYIRSNNIELLRAPSLPFSSRSVIT